MLDGFILTDHEQRALELLGACHGVPPALLTPKTHAPTATYTQLEKAFAVFRSWSEGSAQDQEDKLMKAILCAEILTALFRVGLSCTCDLPCLEEVRDILSAAYPEDNDKPH